MMAVLLAIVSVGLLLYGYLLMCRLDRFLARGGIITEPKAAAEKEILLYGSRETLATLRPALEDANITYACASEPGAEDATAYRWIGAFSDDDAENLLFCLSAKKKNNGIRTMAKCNDTTYETVFRRMGVTAILRSVCADEVLARLRG